MTEAGAYPIEGATLLATLLTLSYSISTIQSVLWVRHLTSVLMGVSS